ncbi:tetratricopeptide repeat protein [Tropicibacter sp. R15_0]|uniref:tetratricopeptide repeat protein n=1 Tax=Tropicibacter sp. R15_0 TaxID=2821101 RepID=UPI001ADD59A3|nr:tetratricopeptide repeat protein [Tropicibacter sp. R15_0]MBO9465710.1 tetratricopeptide repeat protein [Tropicibacter sp. R15_0]
MRKSSVFGPVLAIALAMPLAAQSQETLADIRQDMVVLSVELAKLQRELSTTGGAGVVLSGDQLERINSIETQLQRVTAKAEELEFRISRVVKDGTNRLGDLEFRLCELEPGCDIGNLGQTPLLGGDSGAVAPAPAPAQVVATDGLPLGAGELAVSEEADFLDAQKALTDQDFAGAAQMFALFRETYPQGPLEVAALIGEGRALEGQGDTREAARRYLTAYSGFPEDNSAPEALWRLGVSLAALGSAPEACVTLSEVAARYPGSDFIAQAEASKAEIGCQ